MNEKQSDNETITAEAARESAAEHVHFVYTYESAGITEREGTVPVWLWLVVVVLLVWGLYYLVAYWNPPVTA